jgi:hypothetical protein
MSRIIRISLSLRMVVACLAILMVLVLAGTLYQVEYGLYAAQQKYFYSWFVLLFGFIPFPGTQLTLSVLFINLTASMLFHFRLGWRQAGIVLIHLGLMLLLTGGWVTHQFGEESFLSLTEGEASNVSSDYREWEISVAKTRDPDREVVGIDLRSLHAGTTFVVEGTGIEVEVEEQYAHCRAFRAEKEADAEPLLNVSGIAELKAAPENRDPEANIPGLVLRVKRGGTSAGLLLFGGDMLETELPGADGPCYFSLRRKRYPLPVSVRLLDFERTVHPGSSTPKSFSSQVELGPVEREVTIEMNKPLRIKGYTFFQASFQNLESGAELSTFAVTRNYGRLIPYIATGVTVAGLAYHFIAVLVLAAPGRKAAA